MDPNVSITTSINILLFFGVTIFLGLVTLARYFVDKALYVRRGPKVFSYKKDWSYLDPEYKDIYLPVIPSIDFEATYDENKNGIKEIEGPLVKCS